MVGLISRISTFFKSMTSEKKNHMEALNEQGHVGLLKSWIVVKMVQPGDLLVPVLVGDVKYDNFIAYLKSEHRMMGLYRGKAGDAVIEAIILEDSIFGYFPEEMSNTMGILIEPNLSDLDADWGSSGALRDMAGSIAKMKVIDIWVEVLENIKSGAYEHVSLESSFFHDIYNIIISKQMEFRKNLGLPP